MSRSQFILGIALLVVSATLTFTISFENDDQPNADPAVAQNSRGASPTRVRQTGSTRGMGSSSRRDRTFYEVTVSDRNLLSVADLVQEESLQKLEALTERYDLTTSQRRGIFPLIAARHPQFQEGLVINGSSIPTQSPTSSLESAMYPLLDEEQQEDLEDDALADDEWWSEIISQLREDLDEAISTGELIPTIEPASDNNTPAPGDGEEIENPDIDLNNLFKTKKEP